MIALAVIFAVLLLLALLRVGVTAEYGADGMELRAFAGFVRIDLLRGARKPEKSKKAEKIKKQKKEKPEKKPGRARDFRAMLPAILETLGRFKRKLTVKRLTIHYTAAGDDAYSTAMAFGGASVGLGLLTPILENNLKLKRRDFQTSADFTAPEAYIYVNAAISLAVWEIFYIAAAILPAFLKSRGKKTDGQENKIAE
jgi:hypothetical protein